MKRLVYFFAVCFLLICFSRTVKAQGEVYVGSGLIGPPMKVTRYVNVIGSPYLFDEWYSGRVRTADGQSYKDLKLKYDQALDEVSFRYGNEAPMNFNSEVKAFSIFIFNVEGVESEVNFVNGFEPIDGATKKSYFQVFDPGARRKIEFVKRTVKKIYENRVYNSATTENLVDEKSYYYLLIDQKLHRIKKNVNDVLKYMGDHKAEIQKYISESGFKFKNDIDFENLVRYYNGL